VRQARTEKVNSQLNKIIEKTKGEYTVLKLGIGLVYNSIRTLVLSQGTLFFLQVSVD